MDSFFGLVRSHQHGIANTLARPSRQVNFVSPRYFLVSLVVGSRCRCSFFVVQALALRLPSFFINYHFVSVSRSPFACFNTPQRKLKSEIQKQQLNTPKILFSHHCSYRNRAIRRKCARKQ